MKRSQEIQLQQSEARQRANELTAKADMTTDERTELDTVMGRMQSLETQYRAAVSLENSEDAEARASSDGTSAEVGKLESRAMLGEYLQAAVETRAVSGAEAELNAANGLGTMGVLPWAAIMPREAEQRADSPITAPTTGNPQTQDQILARVFARSATAYLNVSMPSVPTGTASYPVFATGTSAEFASKGTAVDSDAATFESNIVSPTRLSAAYLWRVEDTAATRGLEEALRQDLSMVFSDHLDEQIMMGDGSGANVAGFLGGHADGITIPARGTTGGAATNAKYASFRALYTGRVDGKYANDAGEVRAVVHPGLYQYADSVFRSDESEDTGLMAAQRIGGGFRVCAHVPVKKDKNEVALTYRGTARAAVCPVWNGVRLIRDEITGANKGEIRLTAIALYGFRIIRKDQYAAITFKVEA